MALLYIDVTSKTCLMGFDEVRRVIVCDLWGCWNELQVPALRPVRVVANEMDWTYVDRHDLFRCPDHPFRET